MLPVYLVSFSQVKLILRCVMRFEKYVSHRFSCQSLLLSTMALNDVYHLKTCKCYALTKLNSLAFLPTDINRRHPENEWIVYKHFVNTMCIVNLYRNQLL